MNQFSNTTNEAIQYSSSFNNLVDFFRSAAALRYDTVHNGSIVNNLFVNAYNDNKEIACKLAFWLRNPRNGAGEKASSLSVFKLLENFSKEFILDNLDNIVEYGYWKDLLVLLGEDKELVKYWAKKIYDKNRLACKWAPRLHSKYHNIAVMLRNELGFSNKVYRNYLKDNSFTIEQLITKKLWSEIEYSKVPSIAMKLYASKFQKYDAERFQAWKENKNVKANAGVLYPHDVIHMLNSDEELANKLWENLPNFIKEGERFLPLIDVSGSMQFYVTKNIIAMDVAIALGLYLSEKNQSVFNNKFITFSAVPQLLNINGNTLSQKVNMIRQSDWGMNTNFEAAYKLILDHGIQNNVPQEEMPTMLIVLSDMQFDVANNKGLHFANIKAQFERHGYIAPKMIFWNLRDAQTGSPAKTSDSNVALVSGFSPSIIKPVLECEEISPFTILLKTIESYKVDMTHAPDNLLINSKLVEIN